MIKCPKCKLEMKGGAGSVIRPSTHVFCKNLKCTFWGIERWRPK